MNLEKQIQAYNTTSLRYTEENLRFTVPGVEFSTEEVQYIVSIVTSILMTRDGVGYIGCELVKGIVDDNLSDDLLDDDPLARLVLKFLVQAKQWCAVSY